MREFGPWYMRQKLVISPLLNDDLSHLICKYGHLHEFPDQTETCNISKPGMTRAERARLWEELDKMIDEYRNNLY